MPNPNINWGGTQAVLCNVVATFGVDNTGATDAGPNLAIAFASLAASGQVPWLRSGTYKVTTAAPPAAGQPVWVQPGVTFTGVNAASVANVAIVYGEAPGTPAYNPAWYALTDIYWDPGNLSGLASDLNTGATALLPVLTFREIVRRWGSRSPLLPAGQVTTLHVMSSQPLASASTDPVGVFAPNAPMGAFAMVGVLQAVGSSFTCGAITQISRANPGNDFQVAGMPAGAAVGQILYDSTAASYCTIYSVSAGVATCTSPHSAASLTTVSNYTTFVEDGASWTNGDTCQLYTCPTIYVDALRPTTGTTPGTGTSTTAGASWFQFLNFGDPVGGDAALQTQLTIAPAGTGCTLSCCTWSCWAEMAGEPTYTTGSSIANGFFQFSAEIGKNWYLFGGATGPAPNAHTSVFHDQMIIEQDFIFGTATRLLGSYPVVENSHIPSGVTLTIEHGCAVEMVSSGTNGVFWGAGTILVEQAAALVNRTGQTWVNTVPVAAFRLTSAASTTGTSYTPGTGLWASAVALTAANIDANGGLQDPISGARFTN